MRLLRSLLLFDVGRGERPEQHRVPVALERDCARAREQSNQAFTDGPRGDALRLVEVVARDLADRRGPLADV